MNGVLPVCKEKGYTSHDVVAKLRGICHQKKIGHTGTLDPDATGVLPVCFGNATKLCDFLTDQEKTYRAIMLLGAESDTYDSTGVRLSESDISHLGEEEIRQAILSFRPGYDQVPPMYSAKKVNGKKLYELAREGKSVERKSVYVKIPSIEIDQIDLPHVTFTVTCSKGTYIRSLIHDIGQKLSCGALMEDLIRTKAGGFDLSDALTLDEIKTLFESGKLKEHLLATDEALNDPALYVSADADKLLHNGNPFAAAFVRAGMQETEDGKLFRIYDSEHAFIGLYRYEHAKGRFFPHKMFFG